MAKQQGTGGRLGQLGQVLPIMSVMMVGIMGLTGMVTDIGTYFFTNRVQQNAAEASSHAATSYWATRLASATDQDLYCISQLYSSTSVYQGLSGTCPAAGATVPDNGGQGTKAYYVDFSGNQLGAVGQLGTLQPTLIYPTAAGIRVTTSATSGAFFSRIFNISGFAVNDSATNRIGTAGSVNNPGTTKVFPAVFQLSAYQTAPRYAPSANPDPSQVQTFPFQGTCNATSTFCWSGLQCTANNGNSNVTAWLNGSDPCSSLPTVLAVNSSSLCTSNPPSPGVNCSVSADPGTRDTDYQQVNSRWANTTTIVPIINGTNSSDPIVQFAWFYVTGANSSGNNKGINGFFLDPSQMPPLPSNLIAPCTSSAGVPCGVSGTG